MRISLRSARHPSPWAVSGRLTRCTFSRKPGTETELGFEPTHSNVACQNPTPHLAISKLYIPAALHTFILSCNHQLFCFWKFFCHPSGSFLPTLTPLLPTPFLPLGICFVQGSHIRKFILNSLVFSIAVLRETYLLTAGLLSYSTHQGWASSNLGARSSACLSHRWQESNSLSSHCGLQDL